MQIDYQNQPKFESFNPGFNPQEWIETDFQGQVEQGQFPQTPKNFYDMGHCPITLNRIRSIKLTYDQVSPLSAAVANRHCSGRIKNF